MNNQTLHNKQIAIIGGGPGGLTLARLLQIRGVQVKVYERDVNRQVRVQGATLDLHKESGLAALLEAGLMDAFLANYRPGAEKIRIVDNHGVIWHDEHTPKKVEKLGGQYARPEIDRGPLRNLLLDSLQPDSVVWDARFKSMQKKNDGWEITFENETTAYADIVIGADGASSKIRPYVTPVKPYFVGITALEGNVYQAAQAAPKINALLKDGKIFAFANGKTFIVSAKGDGSLAFYAGFKSEESWAKQSGIDFSDHKQVQAWFKKEFPEWGEIWHELFEIEQVVFTPRPQFCIPLDQKWEPQPNLTLIGDAAHLMPPYAGEGVNMAMLDALELCKSLTNPQFPDTKTAIGNYEKRMFKRFGQIGRMTLYNTEWMHRPKGLDDMLAMFSGNIFKQAMFMVRAWVNTTLLSGHFR